MQIPRSSMLKNTPAIDPPSCGNPNNDSVKSFAKRNVVDVLLKSNQHIRFLLPALILVFALSLLYYCIES